MSDKPLLQPPTELSSEVVREWSQGLTKAARDALSPYDLGCLAKMVDTVSEHRRAEAIAELRAPLPHKVSDD